MMNDDAAAAAADDDDEVFFESIESLPPQQRRSWLDQPPSLKCKKIQLKFKSNFQSKFMLKPPSPALMSTLSIDEKIVLENLVNSV